MAEKIQPPALNKQGKINMRKARHDWKPGTPKLNTDQIAEMIQRYQVGATQQELADAYNTTTQTVRKHMVRAKVLRPSKQHLFKRQCREDPKQKVRAFWKEASSILWRVDGPGKARYTQWRELISELTEAGSSYEDAVVQASREQKCLRNLIRQYKLWEFTLLKATEVELKMIQEEKEREEKQSEKQLQDNTSMGISSEKNFPGAQMPTPSSQTENAVIPTAPTVSKIPCQGIEQPFRENLSWAIQSAGLLLRTGESPTTCPNDTAFFLYQQACKNPKDFLSRFAQIEGRLTDDKEGEELQKAGKRSIAEIEEQLQALDDIPESSYQEEYISEELENVE